MTLLYELFFLVIGFGLLVKGPISCRWGIHLAKRYQISDWVIVITIIALGGSLPELGVSLYAASQGSSQIVLSNIFGSVSANVLLVLGVSAVIFPLTMKTKLFWTYLPMMVISSLFIGFMAWWGNLGDSFPVLSRIDGVVLMALFLAFLFFSIRSSMNNNDSNKIDGQIWSNIKIISFLLLGFTGLFLGSKWVIDSSLGIAGFLA